jgi:hypothetical protein
VKIYHSRITCGAASTLCCIAASYVCLDVRLPIFVLLCFVFLLLCHELLLLSVQEQLFCPFLLCLVPDKFFWFLSKPYFSRKHKGLLRFIIEKEEFGLKFS